ncbi:RNA 3'-phosphate cyclase [Candidatus Woesearchaeota archaeon]|nr:RNA 3'-phosphate cyclase [Candidatus Woesearchaeota archaeon]|tara:strand:- start:7691 stop:8782 length:1092 start_codon:yes stop_codon:yes gene_type:complete
MIQINGGYLESGGQIARTSLALSTITLKPFEIHDIRKGRSVPGLKNQHLYCVKSLQKLCNADAQGAELGSTYLKYEPRKIIAKNLDIDIETAGSITLLLQSLLLPSMFASKPMTLSINGGSDVKWSLSFDFFNNVLLPQLQRFVKIEAKLLKRGYYPKGNGKVEIKINPKFKLNDFLNFNEFQLNLKENINEINLIEQHHLIQIKGVSHASIDLQNNNVAERQAEYAENKLKAKYNAPITIDVQYQNTLSTGSGITLWGIFSKNKDDIDENNPIRLGADSLGERGKKAEDVGEEAATNLIKEIESKAPVDRHLADQLMPFLALTGGSVRVSEITNHCKTNIYTIQQFLGEIFKIDDKEKIISC